MIRKHGKTWCARCACGILGPDATSEKGAWLQALDVGWCSMMIGTPEFPGKQLVCPWCRKIAEAQGEIRGELESGCAEGEGTTPTLSKAQDDMITAWVLGGPDALGKHSGRTVIALERAGYLDRNGPTRKARDYVEAQHRTLVGGER